MGSTRKWKLDMYLTTSTGQRPTKINSKNKLVTPSGLGLVFKSRKVWLEEWRGRNP